MDNVWLEGEHRLFGGHYFWCSLSTKHSQKNEKAIQLSSSAVINIKFWKKVEQICQNSQKNAEIEGNLLVCELLNFMSESSAASKKDQTPFINFHANVLGANGIDLQILIFIWKKLMTFFF